MLLLDIELEIDGTGACGSDTKLVHQLATIGCTYGIMSNDLGIVEAVKSANVFQVYQDVATWLQHRQSVAML